MASPEDDRIGRLLVAVRRRSRMSQRELARAAAVCEVKSDIGSLEETNRRLDIKRRLAPTIAQQQFGWRPQIIGRILIVPESAAIRRTVAADALTMASAYPVQGRGVRGWLREPSQSISGLWFLSEVALGNRDSR